MDIGITKALTPVSEVLQSIEPDHQTAAGTSAPPAVSAVVAAPAPDPGGKLEAIASQLQEFLNSSQRDIEFRVDADTRVNVVTVRDSVSGEVIRQFPGEDVLRVLKNITAQQGTLLNEMA